MRNSLSYIKAVQAYLVERGAPRNKQEHILNLLFHRRANELASFLSLNHR